MSLRTRSFKTSLVAAGEVNHVGMIIVTENYVIFFEAADINLYTHLPVRE